MQLIMAMRILLFHFIVPSRYSAGCQKITSLVRALGSDTAKFDMALVLYRNSTLSLFIQFIYNVSTIKIHTDMAGIIRQRCTHS